jgi:RNA polymerase sigma-70 factor, ECF subfamily
VNRAGPSTDDFASFYEAEFERLGAALWLVCRDRNLAELCVQEAFVRAFAAWRRVRAMDRPDAWLYRTALNVLRRRHRRDGRVVPAEAAEGLPGVPDDDRAALLAALGRLPDRQRQAVTLRYLAGFGIPEMAAVLGISHAALYATLSRARATLRRQLKPNEHQGA